MPGASGVVDASTVGRRPGEIAGAGPYPTVRSDPRLPRRVAISLLLSFLVHLPILGLTFGGDGQGLPGFNLPWKARRVQAPDLRVRLLPPAPPSPAPEGEAIESRPLPPPVVPAVAREEAPAPVAKPDPVEPPARPVEPRLAVVPVERSMPEPPPVAETKTEAAPAPSPSRAEPRPEKAAANAPSPAPAPVPEPAPEPIVIAQIPPELPAFVVPAPTNSPPAEASRLDSAAETMKAIEEAENAARAKAEQRARAKEEQEARARAEQEARAKAEQDARVRAEQEARAKAEQETRERQAVEARLERERLEAARREAARQEQARQEAARQETARQEAARQEVARQEAARQEAARQEVARQEAARREAARQAAARADAARSEAARLEAARLAEAREAEARREERLRAIGRQLDAEAAQREASERLPYSVNTARRARLYGRSDPNEELARYGEAFAHKIQMNMTLDLVRPALRQRYVNPVVTTAVRSNGSVESIHFVVSSGVPALDEAIRRVVRSQEHYPAFPPALAREFDVIEIRRTWHFDVAVRLH